MQRNWLIRYRIADQDLCKEIAEDLQTAAEEDGIGSKSDSEWVYLEIKEIIEDYVR